MEDHGFTETIDQEPRKRQNPQNSADPRKIHIPVIGWTLTSLGEDCTICKIPQT